MTLLDSAHERLVYDRRVETLANLLAPLFPNDSHVLDVGCGDGMVARRILDARPDLRIEGVDVLIRPSTAIPVSRYDGLHLPYSAGEFDAVLLVDVVHHASNPDALIGEAARVARGNIFIKDHDRTGVLAGATLVFMDRVGNARHGVDIPANYWSKQEWDEAFERHGLAVVQRSNDVPLYPWWASWLFGRSLHFIAQLRSGAATPSRRPAPS